MSEVNLYQLFGVNRTASQDEIEARWKHLSRKYHPDSTRMTDKAEAERRFKQLHQAYEVLSNPERRAHYDATGSTQLTDAEAQELKDVLKILGEAFNTLIDQLLQSKRDPTNYDLREIIMDKMEHELGDVRTKIETLEHKRDSLYRIMDCWQTVGTKENYMASIAKGQADQVQDIIKVGEGVYSLMRKALDMLAGHTYSFIPVPETNHHYGLDDDAVREALETMWKSMGKRYPTGFFKSGFFRTGSV